MVQGALAVNFDLRSNTSEITDHSLTAEGEAPLLLSGSGLSFQKY